jgi:hypothetical protein
MEEIIITPEYRAIVEQHSPGQDIGGYSNLDKSDLNKSSRLGFQHTGIYGEGFGEKKGK